MTHQAAGSSAATLVDTHCHLQDRAFDADREEVVCRALDELGWLVVVGDGLKTSREALRLAGDRVYAAVGVHPHNAASVSDDSLGGLQDLAARPGVVAIGEIGLDYYRDLTPRDRQRNALERQLALAVEMDLPVVVHCRDAGPDLLSIVAPFQGRLRAGVMHCFGGDAAFAERCLQTGFHISFAGNVTYPQAAALREAARIVPWDRLLVETDSPYLAPQRVRGKRCEPPYVRYTAERLAELKNVPLEELAQRTTQNACRLFLGQTA